MRLLVPVILLALVRLLAPVILLALVILLAPMILLALVRATGKLRDLLFLGTKQKLRLVPLALMQTLLDEAVIETG